MSKFSIITEDSTESNKVIIKSIKDKDIRWDFDDNSPYYYTKTHHSKYGGVHIKLDPFPCYSHDYNLVKDEANRISKIFPIKFDTYYFLFNYESIGRINGEAYNNVIKYKTENEKETWDGVINLYGKRIPPMPSMTKYLVSHEKAHLIDDWICYAQKLDKNGLDKKYEKLRNIRCDKKYGGRNWHNNIGEIIANDIRICLFNSEVNFWPHDCEHPLKNKRIIEFWTDMKEKYSYKG